MKVFLSTLILFMSFCLCNSRGGVASTAGFYVPDSSLRKVYNFNVGWKFFKDSCEGAEQPSYDDTSWETVNLPHGLEYLPESCSGGVNYQGEAWYRKRFKFPELFGRGRVYLNFEAIMGKSRIWINGSLVKEHFGGFLPCVIDITDCVDRTGENVIAVLADNSDDPMYPPGKSQCVMDFAYFGGIYRDVWLYSTSDVHVTDANYSNQIAGGGVFVHFENLDDKKVDVVVRTEIVNLSQADQTVELLSIVVAQEDEIGCSVCQKTIVAGQTMTFRQKIEIEKPHLWHPDDPFLHKLVSKVSTIRSGSVVSEEDCVETRIGIRSIEFNSKDGFILNGKPFEDKLMGANRHQDFAYIGNAMSNSLHWRDVQKLRNAGMRVIRSAHYPQDPAFLDACDELGMFLIVATPGWQFWNDDAIFAERIYSDIRNMVRRDRNHSCVLMWEPILNETHFPSEFAQRVHEITHEEYPFEGCYTACDMSSNGSEYFDVLYNHPFSSAIFSMNADKNAENEAKLNFNYDTVDKAIFTREWGDNVDDWSSHNSSSRVHRSWGESAMIDQVVHYSRPDYLFTCYDTLYHTPRQHVGGTMWHGFDHNRGYHPDPFWGGIMDAFRQPKYAWYMFQSQRNPRLSIPGVENGPMVYIANEMTPFSSSDIWVYSNCEEVSLKVFGKEFERKPVLVKEAFMPHPPVLFNDVYEFMDLKALHRANHADEAEVIVEGLIDGKVVARASKMPSKRKNKLLLEAEFCGTPLVADGSDLLVVVATLVDEDDNVKRLSNGSVRFEVSGEASIVGDHQIGANPRSIEWGTAPCLVRATTNPGKISIIARMSFEGVNSPERAELIFESVSPSHPLFLPERKEHGFLTKKQTESMRNDHTEALEVEIQRLKRELVKHSLAEVEQQQADFEGNSKNFNTSPTIVE